MPKYTLASRAYVDLQEIVIYIAQENVDAALSLEARFTKVFDLLADNPRMGRERPEFNNGLRSFSEGNYIIFFRIWARKVLIVRVLHAARDLDEIFI